MKLGDLGLNFIQNAKHLKNKGQVLPNWHNFCIGTSPQKKRLNFNRKRSHISPIIFETPLVKQTKQGIKLNIQLAS